SSHASSLHFSNKRNTAKLRQGNRLFTVKMLGIRLVIDVNRYISGSRSLLLHLQSTFACRRISRSNPYHPLLVGVYGEKRYHAAPLTSMNPGARMSIKSDKWMRRMAEQHGMIEPFEPNQVR